MTDAQMLLVMQLFDKLPPVDRARKAASLAAYVLAQVGAESLTLEKDTPLGVGTLTWTIAPNVATRSPS